MILNREGRGLWLNPDITDTGKLQDVLAVHSINDLACHRVSETMNTVSFDGPACIDAVE